MSANEIVYRCFTKATTRESGSPRFSANWAVARRAWLKVYRDHLECGDWQIPAASVSEAVLYEVRGPLGGSVLEVSVDDTTYQFGLNPWVRIVPHLPFAARREQVAMRYSALSIAVRAIVVVWIAYVVWKTWLAG